jgi:hypothetical protein
MPRFESDQEGQQIVHEKECHLRAECPGDGVSLFMLHERFQSFQRMVIERSIVRWRLCALCGRCRSLNDAGVSTEEDLVGNLSHFKN